MQKYIGMNIVNAKPITLGEFSALFDSQRYVKSEDEGYLVEYIGSKPNHSEFDGRVYGMTEEVGDCLPWIAIRTADNKLIPWTPSQQDMLATDWMITR